MRNWGIGFCIFFGTVGSIALGLLGVGVYVAIHFLAKVW